MKALVISDDSNVISLFDDFLAGKGFDTIIYRWLLKALDNIEEIRPDCIIISTAEYPRHWKTLVQFVKSGIGGDNISIFLYEQQQLDEDELEKANALGVTGFIEDLADKDFEKLSAEIDDFFGIDLINDQKINNHITTTEEIIEQPKTNTEPETIIKGTGHLIFTNPKTQQFVNGKYFDFNGSKMTVKVDYKNDISNLKEETHISALTYSENDSCKTSEATVKNIMYLTEEPLMVIELINENEKK